MRIREVWIRNFRNFRADRGPIRFVDEETGEVRPLTVLVGANGSGKTTIFEVIEGLLGLSVSDVFDLNVGLVPKRLKDLVKQGFVADDAPPAGGGWSHLASVFLTHRGWSCEGSSLQRSLRERVQRTEARFEPLTEGLLHFPHDRWIRHSQRGGIEPPPEVREWIYRFQPSEHWAGSLAQLWVWQNYLDLEEQQAGRKNLTPFVDVIEEILGQGQRVQIRQGRVTIQRPHLGDEVGLDELPAGEQQILTLFGDLARRMRPGAVVLIDEAELSLHPALQRAVLFHLRRLGRRYDLQIILTTHSMDLVAAVAPHEVVNLDDMVFRERQRTAEEGARATCEGRSY